tara:strand:+ start:151 stop:474 length:324 start_codon:yes stop_codon:yes gene_type:complete
MDNITPGEIIFGDVTFSIVKKTDKGKSRVTKKFRDMVFSREYEDPDYPIINKSHIAASRIDLEKRFEYVKVIDVKIKARLGFKHKLSTYSKALQGEGVGRTSIGSYQ